MPIYEWKCPNCKSERETLQSMSDPPPICDTCSVDMIKKISISNFKLIGKGFYVNDYKKSSKKQ